MRNRDLHAGHRHLSNEELLLASDGELDARRKPEVAAHLEACWSCRERMRWLENAIVDFVRARNRAFEEELPSDAGPRALLRARLAQAVETKESSLLPRAFCRIAPAAGVFFAVFAAIVMIFEASVSAEGPKPKAGLTPGETRPITLAEICRNPQAEVVTTSVPEETRRKVFSEYGINAHPDNFEVDYLITPDLGGAPSIRNLWPQPYSARWNAHVKDKLEQRLHQLVCSGQVDLATAQHDIAVDWISAYKKYVGAGNPR